MVMRCVMMIRIVVMVVAVGVVVVEGVVVLLIVAVVVFVALQPGAIRVRDAAVIVVVGLGQHLLTELAARIAQYELQQVVAGHLWHGSAVARRQCPRQQHDGQQRREQEKIEPAVAPRGTLPYTFFRMKMLRAASRQTVA